MIIFATMEVTELVINGIPITTLDQPIGLEVNKLSLDRDFQYSCIDTKIEAELKFYCASGKTQLDAEYESKGVEGSGYVTITDTCGTNAQNYTFNLDFKKYNNQGDFTTIGLIEANSLWKKDLDKEVNCDYFSSGVPTNFSSEFYVRNLPLVYEYESDNVFSQIDQDTTDVKHNGFTTDYQYNTIPPVGAGGPAPTLPFEHYIKYSHFLIPRVTQKVNQLEDSDGLVADYFVISNLYRDPSIPFDAGYYKLMDINDISNVVTSGNFSTYSEVEPPELFTNTNVAGTININTINTELLSDFIDITTVSTTSFQVNEIIVIGRQFDTPRYILKNVLDISTNTNTTTSPFSTTKTFSKNMNFSGEVYENEKVWIYYEVQYRAVLDPTVTYDVTSGNWLYDSANYIQFKNINYELANEINIDFTLTKNVANSITGSGDVEPYHTPTRAYYGQTILNHIFGTFESFAQTSCYSDLWVSKGDLLRGKQNRSNTIVKPSDFFRELEKVVCCGIGYFYDSDPDGVRKLMSVYDFYSDTLVPSQYQFDYNDLIDGKIELSPFLPPYYKEIQIGYSNFKDSPKDYAKTNIYSIDNDSENTYSKVSDFIASQYIITRALRLGTDEKDLEFDNNIFILSGGQLGIYNATLSQTSGLLADNIFTNPLNTAGINRRYATALNLFRHLYKWGFSLFADKTELKVVKYEGNSIYDYEIRDTTGTSSNPYYHSLSDCKLPLDNYAKVDRTIEDIYTNFIQSGLYVPTQITFKTANLSSLDLIAMRAHQYDLFSVTDGVNTYYGNLISADLENDVTEIKLLRRFKNGI